MDELSRARDDLIRQFSESRERRVTEMVGLKVRQDIHVAIRKPRFMPGWLYRRLMRTIVVTEGPITIGTPPDLSTFLPTFTPEFFVYKEPDWRVTPKFDPLPPRWTGGMDA